MSNPNRLLTIGLTGSVVAAICCATPVLVVLLGVVGLSAFIALTLYAVHKKRKADACCTADSKTGEQR
ncbi:MAG: hypothetical protein WA173_09390 [Pseudomonas sp.]|uniref:hypothetical protein n=1 Tax=Pseudomonas sp. TaxID=306 RepID=UPI003BB5419C